MEIKFFKEFDFKRFFEEMKKKYQSYGDIKGKVVIKNLKNSEVKAFEEIGKYYKEGETISYKLKELEEFFENSIYGEQNLKNLLFDYYGEEIEHKKEKKESDEKKEREFFDILIEQIGKESLAGRYFNSLFFEKGVGYRTIKIRYSEDRENLANTLLNCANALNNLPESRNETTFLQLFADSITGDPHFFDETGKNFFFLYEGIKYIYDIKIEEDNIDARREILFRAGLVKEGLMNNIYVYGFEAFKKSGDKNTIFYHSFIEKEYLIISAEQLDRIVNILPVSNKIYIVENPSVFLEIISYIKKKGIENFSLICSSGELNMSFYLFMDKMEKDNIEIKYSGDFDPEGILIAQKIRKRYKNVKLFCYEKEIYIKRDNRKKLSNISIKKLENIVDEELKEVAELIKINREGVYQENFLKDIIKEVGC